MHKVAVSLWVDRDIDSDWPTFTGDWQGHHWPFVLGAFEQTITTDMTSELKPKSCVMRCLIYQMERRNWDWSWDFWLCCIFGLSQYDGWSIKQSHWTTSNWQLLPTPVTSCVRSKGWGQRVPQRLAHLSAQSKLCNTCYKGAGIYR